MVERVEGCVIFQGFDPSLQVVVEGSSELYGCVGLHLRDHVPSTKNVKRCKRGDGALPISTSVYRYRNLDLRIS